MLDITERNLKIIRTFLNLYVPNCEVRAFGSRVNGTAKKSSDLDLAIVAQNKLDFNTLGNLRELFMASELPFSVDILDWHSLPESFQKNIEKNFFILQPSAADK
ncbi:MAG: nucleotidyltransferase domain-containing protein [Candidatus Margulisbacteria bacterium]|jgi:predicted nucleotidyltransferase|nr:nucleotidyltransferase domain-containing protein [Candidatus Margulisiibacteriota bacterium]